MVFLHLSLPLQVTLLGLVDIAIHMQLGGVLSLPRHRFLLSLDLSLLFTWVVTLYTVSSTWRLLTDSLLQSLDSGQQLGVGVDLDVVRVRAPASLGQEPGVPRHWALRPAQLHHHWHLVSVITK